MAGLRIRAFQDGDEAALRAVFLSSVHGLARGHYTPAQLEAWASRDADPAAWQQRLRQMRPFVAERQGVVVGYADVQADGYIDQFFVAAAAAGSGVGSALMGRILQRAAEAGMSCLVANVSLAAQGFFARHGFVVEAPQTVTVRGVALCNVRMARALGETMKEARR